MKGNIINVYEQVDANKRKSALVIAGFVAFVVGAIWLLGRALETDPLVIVMAVVFSLLSSVGSFFWGDRLILRISGARPADKKDHFDFFTTTENISLAAQIPVPKLFVIPSPAMNAFATGRDPKHAIVCVTTGLLDKLDRTELEAVIAHEISHVANFDIRLMMIVAVLVGTITLLSDFVLRANIGRNRDRKGSHPAILAIGIIALFLSPLIAKIIQLAISRRREYLADASAVKLTRQPRGLISALTKLAQTKQPLTSAHQATAHLFIVNPFRKKTNKLATAFSTHPPIEDRIATLRKML